MPLKVRSKKDLAELKTIIRNYWLFSGLSVKKIADDFNSKAEYVSKYDTISYSSCDQYIREIRRESENWLDEDVIEKYTGEFVRKQYTMDAQKDKIRDAQKLLDISEGDPKNMELWLKMENAIHDIDMDQIRLMTDVELVLHVKKFNKERRIKNETLILLPEIKDKIAKDRGYKLPTLENKLEQPADINPEPRILSEQENL